MASLRHVGVKAGPVRNGAVLVADACDSEREALAQLLRSDEFAVEEAATGIAALEVAQREWPIAVILDVTLPDLSGYEVCRALRSDDRQIPIIFVSGTRTESYDRVAGLLVGADDYLAKPYAPDELLARVRRLVDRSGRVAGIRNLTRREAEVLELLAGGLSQREIADRLYITARTVGTHIESILKKLGVRSRVQAVALAYRENLVGARV